MLADKMIQAPHVQAIRRQTASVAHDLNNLLLVIGGFSELLRESATSELDRNYTEQVLDACRCAAALTSQLLACTGEQVAAAREVSLNSMVRELDKVLPRLIGPEIDLQFRLNENLRYCKADPAQMRQVIINLVINARDAMPRGGRLLIESDNVELEACQDNTHLVVSGKYVMFSVADTGVGMTPGLKARIFEPFFTTKGFGKGTGLGLSNVRGIAEQNGGFISVDSEPGCGSTFKVFLPGYESATA
jgi:two-component system, cell cycle sensor histidine kinase and response regulator CckA